MFGLVSKRIHLKDSTQKNDSFTNRTSLANELNVANPDIFATPCSLKTGKVTHVSCLTGPRNYIVSFEMNSYVHYKQCPQHCLQDIGQ